LSESFNLESLEEEDGATNCAGSNERTTETPSSLESAPVPKATTSKGNTGSTEPVAAAAGVASALPNINNQEDDNHNLNSPTSPSDSESIITEKARVMEQEVNTNVATSETSFAASAETKAAQ